MLEFVLGDFIGKDLAGVLVGKVVTKALAHPAVQKSTDPQGMSACLWRR